MQRCAEAVIVLGGRVAQKRRPWLTPQVPLPKRLELTHVIVPYGRDLPQARRGVQMERGAHESVEVVPRRRRPRFAAGDQSEQFITAVLSGDAVGSDSISCARGTAPIVENDVRLSE